MSNSRQNPVGSGAEAVVAEPKRLETSVQLELVSTLIRHSRDAALIAPVGTLFLAWVQLGQAPPLLILAWVMCILLPDLLTILFSFRFDRQTQDARSLLACKRRQTLLHTLAGLAWGSAFLFFVQETTPPEQEMKIVLFLMVVSAMAVLPLSTSMPSLVGFEFGIALIPVHHYLFGPHSGHGWLALGTFIVLACALHFGWIAHRQMHAHILSSSINDRLASALSDANLTINETNRQLQEKNEALTQAMEKLNNQATHDELTGLYNRRYILQRLENELQDMRRYQTVCSIALLDLDHFKLVNDRYGHGIGDLVLKAFAGRIQAELRQGDAFARYGGEEFLLVLPMTGLEDAAKLVERLRQVVENDPILREPVTLQVHSSFGVAQLQPNEAVHDGIARADQALYRAKEQGRNRVELA